MEPLVQPSPQRQDDTTPGAIVINLNVKAKQLYDIAIRGIPTTEQKDDKTSITDGTNPGGGYGSSKGDYDSVVYKGHRVTWEIAANDPTGEDRGYILSLTQIAQENVPSNNQFFNGMPLHSNDNGTTIYGSVRTDLGTSKLNDTYSISFTITNTNSSTRPNTVWILLDPKLTINPNQ